MDDPRVTIGGHSFVVPEFCIASQRKVTPALLRIQGYALDLDDDKKFGDFIDTIFMALTIEKGADGKPINDVSKEKFEGLKMKAMVLAQEVLPLLLRQAGLLKEPAPGDTPANGGGAALPDSPLPGASTSTTSSPISSSPPTTDGQTASN